MSTINRYTFETREVIDEQGMVISLGVVALTHPLGQYVKYDDYANMVDQRDAAMMCAESGNALVKQLKDQIAEAKAENERLRKAGDGLMFEGETMAHEVSWNPPWDRVVAAWVAAKEGRDAK